MTKRQITITECDRCGHHDDGHDNFGTIKLLSLPGAPSYDQWDLCVGCQGSFKKWMRKNDY